MAALFYRLIKFLEYETVQNNEEEGAAAVTPAQLDPMIETGEEVVEPQDAVPIEVTGFGGGLLESEDVQPTAAARAGPLAEPTDVSDKIDRLEGMLGAILQHLHIEVPAGASSEELRLSGETVSSTDGIRGGKEKDAHL